LQSLLELGHELAERNDFFEIADVALFNLMGHFGCSKAALWIVPEAGGDVALLRSHGLAPAVARAVGEFWTRWLSGRPSGLREPVLIADLQSMASVPPVELAQATDLAVLAPLATRRRFVGLVALGRRVSGAPFRSPDLDVLSASLDFLGLALEGCQTRVRLVESNRQLRAANAGLEELDRLKSDFLRNLNHELRTPLTVITAHLDSLLMDEALAGARRSHVQVAREETSQLEAMLLQLLDFRQLAEDRLAVDLKPNDVAGALRAYVEDRRPGLTASLRELRFSAAEDALPAVCDPRRVLQVVDCFVDNATKFTPEGSVIQVRVEPSHGSGAAHVRVEVQDNGPGIAPDRRACIWESFRQGDGSATRAHGGLGLGLPLARRLAQLMRAEVGVDSELGRGSTFWLLLPTT
jgi:signal transduction histidine kinase